MPTPKPKTRPSTERRGRDYYTLAGMLIDTLGHIPVEGESTTWHGLKFEVVDLDGARIDKVLVSPVAKGEQAGEAELDDG